MRYKHFQSFILLALFTLTSFAAQAGGLLVSPQRMIFQPNERLKELRVVNRGDVPKKYRISIINRKMTETGQMQPATEPGENEFFADRFLRFGPRQVELQPKESQTVRIMSRLPANAKDGEYRSHVLIQEIPDAAAAEGANKKSDGNVGVNVQAIFGMSVPIFMRKGDLTAEVTLSDPKIVNRYESTFAEFTINHEGNKSVLGTAKVFTGDKEIAILKTIAVYLSASSRTVLVEIPEEYAQKLSGKPMRITYSAIESGEDTPTAEISFTAP